MRAKLPSRPKRTTGRFMYQCATPDPASPMPTRPSCFKNSSKPTMQSRAKRAAPAWDWPYRSASLRCTAARSGSSPSLAKVLRSLSSSRSSSNVRWSRHEQAHSVVEDQPDNRQIIRDMLAPTDYEIIEVEDGEQAPAARSHPDGYPTADHGWVHGHEPY